ncbi:ABC transporter ATP-binding protein [Candidatus Saccharibacteria bacterium]|nr:ABC transporter ATP-binding protein [Candidatus Saccharibacteria bacterium]
MTNQTIIKIENLEKSFGKTKAVRKINLEVYEGSLFAFLGINGAGKSTTISMMYGGLKIDSGRITICGQDVATHLDKIKNQIGVVFQDSVLDKTLTVYENLKFRAGFYGIFGQDFKARYQELEKLFDLAEIKNQKIQKLSGGQKRRVDIARAIIHQPKILILDAPTTGLDPGTRSKVWRIISKLREDYKMTIFLTTHYMEEAADADYVTILDKGRIIAEGTPLELKTQYATDVLHLYGVDESEVKKLKLPYQKIHKDFQIKVKNSAVVTQLIVKNPELFQDFELIKSTLDDVFLAVTKSKPGTDISKLKTTKTQTEQKS